MMLNEFNNSEGEIEIRRALIAVGISK